MLKFFYSNVSKIFNSKLPNLGSRLYAHRFRLAC